MTIHCVLVYMCVGCCGILYDTIFSQQGLDSGFAGGSDDMYNVYDKPWRAGAGMADKIYRPSKAMDKDIYGDDVEKLIKTSK